ncbi:MAG: Cas9 endonuclease PAM-interacting domain-containing protein, partial [Ruminococcus sp.]|nr:Cas9 endonuclease PAM-interacting domain-containing protein [Ruminococcus sp.]
YFVACALYNNSKLLENESIYNTVSEKWPSLVKNEITEDVISKAKSDLNAEFLKADDHGSSEKDVYGTSIVNNKFIRALDALTDNYVHGTGTYEQGETSVASAAATCAYYYFPYSYQQYQFIESKTNQQILVTTVLAMAYNEFLSYQGEYLSNNYTGDWSNQVDLEHTSSSDSGQTIKQTYSELKKQYTDEWGIIGESIVELYTSTLYIDASSFTGSLDDITTNFNQYMRVEDSVAVNLSIQGYENEVSYYQELKDHDQLPFTRTGDLTLINEAKKSGATTISNKIIKNENIHSFKIIHQSVTGLFEQEIELLN